MIVVVVLLFSPHHQIPVEKCRMYNFDDTTATIFVLNKVVDKDQQVLQFIGREDVNQYVVISYTMLVSEKAELEIEVTESWSNYI